MTDKEKANVLDFSTLIQPQVEEGRLFFNQRRAVIFDAGAMGTLRQQLIETLGHELAMGMLIRFGYTYGHNDAKQLEESFDWETETDWLAAGPIINSMAGLVHVTPEEIEFDRETGHFYMHGVWRNSYEAEEHLNRYGPSDHPVCWSLIGYISGYTSAFFGQELMAIETKCVGQGDDRCHWEIRPVAEWGADPRVAPYLDALESMDLGDLLARTNQRLRESEARFRDVTLSSTDWIWETDADSRYTYCSSRVEETLGYTVEEILGKTPFDLMPQDKAASANEILGEIMAQKQPITDLENLITAKDGRAVCLLTNGVPRFDEQGNLTGYRGVSKDVTESKSAGETLQETQRLLQDILDHTTTVIYVKDLEGRYILVNRRYTDLFNIEREEIIGKSAHDIFPQKLADEYWQSDLDVVRAGIPQEQMEKALITDKSGTQATHTYLSHKFLIYDNLGTPCAVCGIATDVSEREITHKEREQLLTEMESQARQLQTALDKTEMLYQGSTRIVHAANADEILHALVESTPLERFDRANILFFNRPWEDEAPPDTLTVTAGWERTGSPASQNPHTRIGTPYSLDKYPLMDLTSPDGPTYIRDVVTDERVDETLRALLVDGMGMRSLVLWPLVTGGQWLGLFISESSTVQELNQDEIRQVTSLVGQATAALQSQRLFGEAQQVSFLLGEQVKELDCLNDIGRKIDEAPPVPEFLEWVAERIPQAMQHSDVCLVAIEFQDRLYGTVEATKLPRQIAGKLQVSGGQMGRITIAYTQDHYFLKQEGAMLEDIARRISGYIENRRLMETTQAALAEAAATHRSYLRQEWQDYLQKEQALRQNTIVYDQEQVTAVSEFWRPEMELALTKGDLVTIEDLESRTGLAIPIVVRGQTLGVLGVEDPDGERKWSAEELDLIQAIGQQLGQALENTRLIEATQRRAARERLTGEITTRMRETMDVDTVLQTAVQEMRQALGLHDIVIRLKDSNGDVVPSSDSNRPARPGEQAEQDEEVLQ